MKIADNTLEDISEFLNRGIKATRQDIPGNLVETKYVQKDISPPSRCPDENCNAQITRTFETEKKGYRYEAVCKQGHSKYVTEEKAVKYIFQPEKTISEIISHLGLTPDNGDSVDVQLPRYVKATTQEEIDVYLIADPHRYSKTVQDILSDVINQKQPVLLLTPRKTADEIIDLAESYPLGSLVTPIPLELLSEQETVNELLSSSKSALDIEEAAFKKRNMNTEGLARKLSQHPRLIEAQLNYIRILREDPVRRYDLGEQMETVCKAAFMTLDCRLIPEFGGTENRGEKVPDIVFQLPYRSEEEKGRELHRVLAIVDAKSGADADFDNEDIVGKHQDYLRRAKEDVKYRDHDLTHIFVVFDIDDYNEIDWFDGIKSEYRENTGMVILYADALLLMVRAAQATLVRNQINLAEGEFENFIRPFFQKHLFTNNRKYPILAKTTRFDDVDAPTKRQIEYQDEYAQRPGLLVVTHGMVQRRLESSFDKEGIEPILAGYDRG
jgi:hypothetical protein